MMTAASVLFVLTLALRFNPVDHSTGPAPTNGSVAQTPEKSSPSDGLVPEGSRLVNEPYRLQMDDMELPVFDDLNQFEAELQRIRQFDPALVQRFQEAGYYIQPDVRYITGTLSDGRQVIMPVQRFQVIRIGQ